MLFHSYLFVFVFLPICLIGHYGLLYVFQKKQNSQPAKVWLILLSLIFYAWLNPVYLFLLIGSMIFNYGIYRWIVRGRIHSNGLVVGAKLPLFIGILGNLGLLFYFKYTDFFLDTLNSLFQTSLPLRKLVLPLGISFFTFQQIAFLVDAKRGEVEQCSMTDYLLYLTFFPKLTQGPITLQQDLLPQFQAIGKKTFDWEQFYRSVMLFAFGMMKKVLIADVLGSAADYGYANIGSLGAVDAIIVMLSYTLQLYFDFSGYCDMAMGISGMLGIELPLNFNSPYKASNIIEFWKGWHITLTRFFTKYVYIPLGGNRKGRARMYLNLLIIFFLSGLWHGAGWNFILWGMMHGVLYALTRLVISLKEKKHTIKTSENRFLAGIWYGCKVFLTFLYVNIAWIFFRVASIQEGFVLIGRIFSGTWQKLSYPLADCFNLDELWYGIKILHLAGWQYSGYILMFVILAAVLFLTFGVKNAYQITRKLKPTVWIAVLTGGLFAWCVLHFANVTTFLYVNF